MCHKKTTRGLTGGRCEACTGPSAVPLIDWRLGRMVTAPSAISSCCTTGEIFEPQLSEPTQMKCPVWLAFLAAWRSRLQR